MSWKKGNAEFVHSAIYDKQRESLIKGQRPHTVVVSCSDSRLPPEIILSQLDLGQLFVVRTAGHVVDNAAYESIKYAVDHLRPERILVIGHESCGAVQAAINGAKGFPTIVNAIRPAIKAIVRKYDLYSMDRASFLELVIAKHTANITADLKSRLKFQDIQTLYYNLQTGILDRISM